MQLRYEYRRCDFRGKEWKVLIADGWTTVHVNTNNVALLLRER